MADFRPESWKALEKGFDKAHTIDEVLTPVFAYVSQLPGVSNVSILRPRKMRLKRIDDVELHTNGEELSDVLLVEACSANNHEAIGKRIPFGYGITGIAAQLGATQVIDNIESDIRYVHCTGRPITGSEIAVPLYSDDERKNLVGVLEAQSLEPFSNESIETIRSVGEKLGWKLCGITKGEKDHLTGLINQKTFESYAKLEIQYAFRNDYNLSFAVLDLDNFKKHNDTLGHLSGNELLTRFGEEIRTYARESDLLCRVGGDEFLIVMPETNRDEARTTMVRLVTEIGDQIKQDNPELLRALGVSHPIPLGISYGIGSLYYAEKMYAIDTEGASIPHDQDSFNKLYDYLYKEADMGLYRMKAHNKVGR